MQVAEAHQGAVAATLGAQETIEFSVVQDTSFLLMMSTNLYSNQNLAAIRETMCNAWDAHIEAGRTHLPVKITITSEDQFIIQDSGLGIPHNMIGPIYGTYGASTKANNDAVTGGFGLGCKSPFAVTDSFRVTSENAGRKVLYNMSKASVEANGKPGITKIMELPTEREGLTVAFQLQPNTRREIIQYVQAIAKHGEMLVDFVIDDAEVERLPVLGMDTTPGTYNADTSQWKYGYMGQHSVFVRYGAVVYPALRTPATEKAIELLETFMELIGVRSLLVQAAPGSLALTPNREALSSSKMTENGITDLCVDLVARMEDEIIAKIPASMAETVKALESGASFSSLRNYRDPMEHVTPYPVKRYLGSELGKAKYQHYLPILMAAEKRGFKRRHSFKNKAAQKRYYSLRGQIMKSGYSEGWEKEAAFKRHFILRPLAKTFCKHSILDAKRLRFSCEEGERTVFQKGWMEHIDSSISNVRPLVDNPVVFVTSRLKNVAASIDCCPTIMVEQPVWVYKIEPTEKEKDAIIKAFEDGGYTVVDLTLNHDWDEIAQELVRERKRKAAEKERKTPAGAPVVQHKNMLISLACAPVLGKLRAASNIRVMKQPEFTTDTPLFYVELTEWDADGDVGSFAVMADLTDDELKHGVFVRNGTERNMAIKRGAVSVDKYFAKVFWDAINSPEYKEYATKQRKPSISDLYGVSSADLKLCRLFGIKVPGYDKLTFNKKFERLGQRIANTRAYNLKAYLDLTEEECNHYRDVISKYKLEELPFITKLKALHEDMMFRKLGRSVGVLDLIQNFPERTAALKSLVLSVIKSGTKK